MKPDGSATGRHCARCQTSVHDLSAMTEAQARLFLLRQRGPTVCVRYESHPDGEVRFRSPPPRGPGPMAATVAGVIAACTGQSEPVDGPPVEVPMWVEGGPTIPGGEHAPKIEWEEGEQRTILVENDWAPRSMLGVMINPYPVTCETLEPREAVGLVVPKAHTTVLREQPTGRQEGRRPRSQRRAERRERKREHRSAREAERQLRREHREAKRAERRQTREAEQEQTRQARKRERQHRRLLRKAEREARREARRAERQRRRLRRRAERERRRLRRERHRLLVGA